MSNCANLNTVNSKFIWEQNSQERYEEAFTHPDIVNDIKTLLNYKIDDKNVECKLQEQYYMNNIYLEAASRSLKCIKGSKLTKLGSLNRSRKTVRPKDKASNNF